jgi:hypothetical protein
MNERKKPVTKKSRMIAELSSAIVSLVQENGVYSPTKAAIVDYVVQTMVRPGTPTVFTDMLRSETANMLETYFSEVCRAAGDELDLPFHYTSKKWHSKKSTFPQSKVEARQYIVMFGNGRIGKAAGVRFVTKDDDPDPMLLCALEKDINMVNAAINSHSQRIKKLLSSDAISITDSSIFRAKLPAPKMTATD